VGLEGAHGGHAPATRRSTSAGLRPPPCVFAALDVEAHELLEGRADPHQDGKVEQAQHGLVPGDQLGVASNTAMAWSRRSKPASSRS
jgi:hypothetical protein